MDACVFHPDRPAIERCEICKRSVCAEDLWYAATGERLCRDHGVTWTAEGRQVHPPERYGTAVSSGAIPLSQPLQSVPYQGNSTDLAALLSAMTGVASLASCAGLSFLFPLVAFFLGLVAWLQGSSAVDRVRTRWLSVTGMVSGGIFFFGFFAFMTLCGACWIFTLGVSGGLGGSSPP